MHILELLGLVSVLAILLGMFSQTSTKTKTGIAMAAVLMVTLGGFAQPSWAAAANDNALSTGQKALNETLKTDPQGNQYQGIEYPQVTGEALSDRQITARIYETVPDHLKVSVSSGAVRLSGEVTNQRTAQKIVQDVKEIPGIHEVSYDLGLAS